MYTVNYSRAPPDIRNRINDLIEHMVIQKLAPTVKTFVGRHSDGYRSIYLDSF